MGQRDGGENAMMVRCGGGHGLCCMCHAFSPVKGLVDRSRCPVHAHAVPSSTDAQGAAHPLGVAASGLRCFSTVVFPLESLAFLDPDRVFE